VIQAETFPIEPWQLRESWLSLDLLAQSESLFALSNGHLGVRGTLDEGEPYGRPGSYLNGVYELRPLPYAEAGYGYPEAGQSVINVTDGKLLRLLVNDEPLDVRYGRCDDHERVLSLRDGVLTRRARWHSPAGRTVDLHTRRLVSLTQRAILACSYRVSPVDGPADVVIQSELVANEELPRQQGMDPRVSAALEQPLVSELATGHGTNAVLVHRTDRSRLRVAAAMGHRVEGDLAAPPTVDVDADTARVTFTAHLDAGQSICIEKFVAYGWSEHRSVPALRAQVEGALAAVLPAGWAGVSAEQRAYLDAFWLRADVVIDGDDAIQQAVRFGLFHLLQASARAEGRPLPAKGLTGDGYDGHAFWDTEMFVLPMLTYTTPDSARDALRWRASTLPQARERAGQLGLAGATFPWRTIHGEECSSYWPAGTAAFHVNADVADAAIRYVNATDDHAFEEAVGLELLGETARLWRSLGHLEDDDEFHIDGVTGPDEYSAVTDDNIYTNLMAQRNLRGAATAANRHPARARRLGFSSDEVDEWMRTATAVHVPYDRRLQVHEQSAGYTSHECWDFDSTDADRYPLLLWYPYFDLYRKQVVKQADLVLALHVCGDSFTPDEKARAFDYYEGLTVRDSSLSAGTQAIVAAEVGCIDLAYDYLAEAALLDLRDLQHNTRTGLHLASLASAWAGVVAGFGGMRDHHGLLTFSPRLPPGVARISFSIVWKGQPLTVDIGVGEVTYTSSGSAPVELTSHGQPVSVPPHSSVRRAIPELERRASPAQPAGRQPRRRRDYR
jgi:alpha,alpha-trehalose phosphorylase